jgi:hypothetical protein
MMAYDVGRPGRGGLDDQGRGGGRHRLRDDELGGRHLQDGRVRLVPNAEGTLARPSVVAFAPDGPLIGAAALRFDVDAGGTLRVTATDLGTGRTETRVIDRDSAREAGYTTGSGGSGSGRAGRPSMLSPLKSLRSQ